jgi:hypothetical protein
MFISTIRLQVFLPTRFNIYNDYWFFGRPTIEELREDLRTVLKKCRPDWDISTPELKAAWKRREHGRFYPYGKTYGQVFREQQSTAMGFPVLSAASFLVRRA